MASVIDYYGDNQDVIIANAGPGHWNDPDMVRKNVQKNSCACDFILLIGARIVQYYATRWCNFLGHMTEI